MTRDRLHIHKVLWMIIIDVLFLSKLHRLAIHLCRE